MSSQTNYEAMQQWEAHYKTKVMESMWGHLAPRKNKTYKGFIVFCVSVYGDITPINCEFQNLPDSPWFFDALQDFIYQKGKEHKGKVFRFDGTFCNYNFDGIIKEIKY